VRQYGVSALKRVSITTRQARTQARGLTLIELLVALAVGLIITIAAASLFIFAQQSFRINDDRTRILENGRLVMDLLTRNIRMAAALDLRPYQGNAQGGGEETVGTFAGFTLGAGLLGIEGNAQPDSLAIVYESIDQWNAALLTGSDCLAQRIGANGLGDVVNTYAVDTVTQQLTCSGSGAPGNTQPIVGSVADLQLQYSFVPGWDRVDRPKGDAAPAVQVVNADAVTNWGAVRAVHVCVDIVSAEPNSLNQGQTNGITPGLNCRGQPFADDNRVHRLFRSVVAVRNFMPGNTISGALP
jgi:type IV pilus assembly protein PilW